MIFILVILICGLVNKSHSSPQIPDLIIYKGDTIPTYHLLVEEYLRENHIEDNGQLFGLSFREGSSLNCWRGYQAIYEIEDEQLFLIALTNCGEFEFEKTYDRNLSQLKMKKIFGNKVNGERVLVDWHSGKISLPKGDLVRWDGVFYKIYDRETLVKLENGEIQEIVEIVNYEDDPQLLNRKYNDTISTIFFDEIKSHNWKSKFDCSERYSITIDKNGLVDKIIMIDYQTEEDIKDGWDKREYKYCIKNIKQALSKLRFDILKDKGQPIAEAVYLEIWFEEGNKIENWTN